MTPQELYDLYAPVMDRIGWPVSHDGLTLAMVPRTLGDGFWCWMESTTTQACDCGEDEAAALLRCRVEDWLESNAPERITIVGSVEGWSVQTCPPCEYHGQLGYGPTIHHALVAAALAVLEGR
jgi:hypothetical protein